MTQAARLGTVVHRFNVGCQHFDRSVQSWKDGNLLKYEDELRRAAIDTIGALEWGLKIYLRSIRRDSLEEADRSLLKHPTFHDLMGLMRKYSAPILSEETRSLLYDYRTRFRNAAEHDASIPPSQELHSAILTIREVLTCYLDLPPEQLLIPTTMMSSNELPKDQQELYFETLRSRYEYMDLGGISPRVGGKVVKIRMADLYIPLQVVEEQPLFETVGQEEVDASSDIVDELDEDGDDDGISLPARHREANVSEIFEDPRVVILGHPGSGKTTIGKFLAYAIATENLLHVGSQLADRIPIVIRASEYGLALRDRTSLSLFDFITRKETTRYTDLFERAIVSGRTIIVIDGLDEIPEAELRITVARRVEQFVSEYRSNRFVITSRIVGYRQNQLAGDFTHVTLRDLDEGQVVEFLKQWFRAIEAETNAEISEVEISNRANELWEAIEGKPGIAKLAGNPLLLTIIALANWRGTKLPNRRVELYQIATETLIENWPLKQRGITLDAEEIESILEPIAHHIFLSGRTNLITEREFRPLFESQVCEVRGGTPGEAKALSREILQTIEEHTGFFLERGIDEHGQRAYGFLHLTFAEYLTARHLAEQWSNGKIDLSSIAHDPRWHEVVLLMAGHIGTWSRSQATRFVHDILNLSSEYEHFLHRDLFLAGEVLADNLRIRREVQDQIVQNLLRLAFSASFPQIRRVAQQLVVRIAKVLPLGDVYSDLEFASVDNSDVRIRKLSTRWRLGERGDEILTNILLEFCESPERYPELFYLFDDESSYLAPQGFRFCAICGDNGADLGFVVIPIQIADDIIRLAPPCLSVVTSVNSEVSDGIGPRVHLFDPNMLARIDSKRLVTELSQGSNYQRLALKATIVSSHLYEEIGSSLVKIASSGNSLSDRVSALITLADLADSPVFVAHSNHSPVPPKWGIAVEPLLDDPEPQVRINSLRIASSLAPTTETVATHIRGGLTDADAKVRANAIRMHLQNRTTPSEDFQQVLLRMLEDSSLEVYIAAVHALIHYGNEEILCSRVLPLLKDRPVTEWQILDLLNLTRRIRESEVLTFVADEVRSMLKSDGGIWQRDLLHQGYFFYLAKYHRFPSTTVIAQAVAEVLDQPETKHRIEAAVLWLAFRKRGTEIDRVVALLGDSESQIRAATCDLLWNSDLQNVHLLDYLNKCLQDPVAEVATAAARALSRVRNPELRIRVIRKLGEQLGAVPDHSHAFSALWSMFAPNRPQ